MKFRDVPTVGGGNYLKLKAGESVKGVFRGDLLEFYVHWVGNRTSACTEQKDCALCLKGIKASFRFKINFVVRENGARTAKIWEQGGMVYAQLKSLHEGGYNLPQYAMQITREGSGTSTTYQIMPVMKGEVTPEIEKEMKAVKLQDLHPPEAVDVAPETEDESDFALPDDGVPF